MDFSTIALHRAAAHADSLGADVAIRIEWVHADLTTWAAGAGRFDLVSARFVHLPAEPRQALFARLADAVAPGGTLLVVGHHPSDLRGAVHRPPAEVFFTAEEVAAGLEADSWEVLVVATRARTAVGPQGEEITVHDAVTRARRRGGTMVR